VIDIYVVFEMFRESLLAVNQSNAFALSRLIEFYNIFKLLSLCTKTVPSAKSIAFIRYDLGKSFLNK